LNERRPQPRMIGDLMNTSSTTNSAAGPRRLWIRRMLVCAALIAVGAYLPMTRRAVLSTSLDPAAPQACSSPALTEICRWSLPPAFKGSRHVMMTPVVMDLYTPPVNSSQVAFVSYGTSTQINNDQQGVLRVIDSACHEIAHFPDFWIPAMF
jgi:hypothetical protein